MKNAPIHSKLPTCAVEDEEATLQEAASQQQITFRHEKLHRKTIMCAGEICGS